MCSPPFQAQISVTKEHVILSLYKHSYKKECTSTHSHAERSHLRQSASSREYTSLARSSFLFSGKFYRNFLLNKKNATQPPIKLLGDCVAKKVLL